MKANHTPGPWKVMPCPIHKGKHILQDHRWIALDNHIYNIKALQGYSRWVPTTPTESELINAIKYSVKRSKDAIKKATE